MNYDQRTAARVGALDRLNQLSHASHHAARVLENLQALRERLPSKGFDDVAEHVVARPGEPVHA